MIALSIENGLRENHTPEHLCHVFSAYFDSQICLFQKIMFLGSKAAADA
jgi:hypothetical protein